MANDAENKNGDGLVLAKEKTIDVKKRKRNNILGLILTLVIFACVIYALWQLGGLLENGNVSTLGDLAAGMNGWYLLAAFGLLAVIMICDVLKYTLLNGTFGCKIGLVRDAKLGLTGKYYESITPTSTGGQPMQILYLIKQGVSGSKSSSVVMLKYAVQMFAAAIVGAVVMGVWGYTLAVIETEAIRKTVFISGWVGFGINACAPVFVTLIIFCPNVLKWVINLGLVLLHKMHLLKNLDEKRAKVYDGIDNFAVCSQFIFKHPAKFFELLGLCMVEPILLNIIPYFVMTAFCGGSVAQMDNAFFTIMALSIYATYAVVYIPTPGNSGALETVFMLAFASISGEAMFWVAIICRFFSYYVYVALGLGMNAWDLTRGIIRRSREKKAEALAAAEAKEDGGASEEPAEETAEGVAEVTPEDKGEDNNE